jgi:predicted DNA-binding protein (UPF0251 family)
MKVSGAWTIETLAGVAANGSDREEHKLNGETSASSRATEDSRRATEDDRDLWLYRDRIFALLKRYVRLAVEIGRLPSLLGREFFRGRVTTYSFSTFEDTVIFVHDMEQSVDKLNPLEQAMIGKIVLEEYSQREAAKILNCPLRTVERLFPDALDHLSKILLDGGIVTPIGGPRKCDPKPCQGGESSEAYLTSCNNGK